MWAELRSEYDDYWGLEVVEVRGGERRYYFGEGIKAPSGRETEVAAARLELAGYHVRGWNAVDGGWDGALV
jgi:hypothetical protein